MENAHALKNVGRLRVAGIRSGIRQTSPRLFNSPELQAYEAYSNRPEQRGR